MTYEFFSRNAAGGRKWIAFPGFFFRVTVGKMVDNAQNRDRIKYVKRCGTITYNKLNRDEE